MLRFKLKQYMNAKHFRRVLTMTIYEFDVNARINESDKVTTVRDLLSSDKSDKKPWNKFGYAKRFQLFSLSLTSSNMI